MLLLPEELSLLLPESGIPIKFNTSACCKKSHYEKTVGCRLPYNECLTSDIGSIKCIWTQKIQIRKIGDICVTINLQNYIILWYCARSRIGDCFGAFVCYEITNNIHYIFIV